MAIRNTWWREALWEVPLLLALLLFLELGERPDHTRLWEAVFEFGHVPLFGVIALAIRSLLARRRPDAGAVRLGLEAFAATVAVGLASEVVQILQVTRDASWADLASDAAGAASFLLLHAAWWRRGGAPQPPADVALRGGAPNDRGRIRGGLWRLLLAAAAVAVLFASARSVIFEIAATAQRRRVMPALARFDGSWWERGMVTATNARLQARPRGDLDAANDLVRLELRPGPYPGVRIDEPYPDWRGYRALAVTVASDLDAPLKLTVRVHDARHDQRYADRFNRTFLVSPGTRTLEIPLDDIRRAPDRREMDLSRVRAVIMFVHRLDHPARLYLGPLRLVM